MALGQVFQVRVRSRPTKTGPVLDVPLPRVLVCVDRRVTVGAAWKRTFLNGLNYNSQLLLTTNNLQKKFKIKHEFQKWVIIKLLSLIFSFFYNRMYQLNPASTESTKETFVPKKILKNLLTIVIIKHIKIEKLLTFLKMKILKIKLN